MASHAGPKTESDGSLLAIDSANIKSNPKLVYNLNLLDYSTWANGQTGSVGMFGQNGSTTENYRIYGTDPVGQTSIIWEARPDAVSGPDGGWNTSQFAVDASKLYRFSVWIRRTVLGNGSYYFGCYGYNSAGTNIGVLNRSNAAVNTNPYFRATSGNEILSTSSWFLLVAHIWPLGSGAGAVHVDTGLYNTSGTKIATPIDFVWNTATAKASHRTYLYYSTDITTRQQWSQPRVDLCNGNETPIGDLIQNKQNQLISLTNNSLVATIKNKVAVTENKTLSFNNNTHYLALPNNLGYTTALSAVAWVKIAGAPKGGYHIICGGAELELSIPTAGQLRAGLISGGTRYVENYGSGLADGRWHHVGMTVSGTTKTAYIDGIAVGTQVIAGTPTASFANRAIGQFGADTTYALNGELSGYRVYNRALTPTQMRQNFIALRGRFGV